MRRCCGGSGGLRLVGSLLRLSLFPVGSNCIPCLELSETTLGHGPGAMGEVYNEVGRLNLSTLCSGYSRPGRAGERVKPLFEE